MINSLLVAATLKAFEELLKENEIPYEIYEDDSYNGYIEKWNNSSDHDLLMRQVRPAVRRIAFKEPYLFMKDGDPLCIKFNDQHRRMEDSFGEMLLERADKDWRIAFSIKNDAKIIATTPVADRSEGEYDHKAVTVYNEIEDFGFQIFGIPCSNDYFNDVNAILESIGSHDKETWRERLKDDDFAYKHLITPILTAIGREVPRICKDHPEAPQKLIDFFYGKIDYYFLKPINEVQVTRIGAINSHGGLGRIPNNNNHYTACVDFPTQLLDVRFVNGKYGELSNDTIQFTFDGGWSVCLTVLRSNTKEHGRNFVINAYLPVTPFGSYRDQVPWDPEN